MTGNTGHVAASAALGMTLILGGCLPGSPSYEVVIGDDDPTGTDAAMPDSTVAPAITEMKYLLVVDTSGSMQCTDENNFRYVLAADATATLGGEPGKALGLIRFNESVDIADNSGDGIADFLADPISDPAFAGVLSRLNTADGPSSFHGAMLAAYLALNGDMLNNSWGGASLATTGYTVIIITDGAPDPSCNGGMLGGSGSECSSGLCGNTVLFCETPREEWASIGLDPNDPNLWFGYEDGMPYNRPEDVLGLVDDIVGLAATHGAASVSVHALYLHPPTFMNGVCSGWDVLFGTGQLETINFLTDLADRGNGTLRLEYDTAVDWLGFF